MSPRDDFATRPTTSESPSGRAHRLALTEEGVPKTLPLSFWWAQIEELLSDGTPWDRLPELYQNMIRTTLRFTRPDGSIAFEPPGARPERVAILQKLADPGLATVSNWWAASRAKGIELGPPPLPAFGSEAHPIAILRADWARDGDFLAVDARHPAVQKVELTLGGQPVLGPDWSGATGKARPQLWKSSYTADCAEWSSGAGASRIIRTAVLLRGRKLALFAETRSGSSDPLRMPLADRVDAKVLAETRVLSVKAAGGGPSARIIALGLDDSAGCLRIEGRTLTVDSPSQIGRSWRPLLVSWDQDRNRQSLKWRQLTVTENSKRCKPGVAFAVRVAWGPIDQLVIYRSLAKAATRTFLGHQTSARFLIGTFDEKGDLKPLLQVDD